MVEKLSMLQTTLKDLENEKLQPAVTCDIWTNKAMKDSAISFTIHYIDQEFKMHMLSLGAIPFNETHTSENIVDKLTSLAEDTLGLKSLDVILTTDGAENMAKSARLGGLFWIRCLLHTIHIAVGRGMESIDDKQ